MRTHSSPRAAAPPWPWPGVRLTRWLALLVAAWLLASQLAPRPFALAQAGITVLEAEAPSIVFGEVIVFEVAARSADEITSVTLHLQAGQQEAFSWTDVAFEPGREIEARANVDAATAALPPFSPVSYWWELETEAGASLTTPAETFFYEDDRFAWLRLTQGSVTVHWYEGGTTFGKAALKTAAVAFSEANRDIRAPLPERLDLYLYANPRDVQAALQRVGATWADGHADVDLGVVVAVVAADLSAEFNLRREIPHELTHILIARATGENYRRVPVWLNEGLAGMNQVQPEPDFPAVLAAARDAGEFLPFETLCGAFPPDPAAARLAYAQSEGLARYIRGRYGAERVNALLGAYASGASCSGGVEEVLGVPLPTLERQWLDEVVLANPAAERWRFLAPWLVLTALVAIGPLLFLALILRRGPASPPGTAPE